MAHIFYLCTLAVDPDGRKLEELKSGVFSWKRALFSRTEVDATELVAATVAEAAHYLDVALDASRRLNEASIAAEGPAHFFFTFNVYRNYTGGAASVSST